MGDRVTAYAIQSNGSRSYGLTVRGIKVLITADETQHESASILASAIAGLWPADIVEPTCTPKSEPKTTPVVTPRREFVVGQTVWCRVHGSQGLCKITEIGAGRNYGRVKISGVRGWCPDSNFLSEEPR
jgi:hypothetical protein